MSGTRFLPCRPCRARPRFAWGLAALAVVLLTTVAPAAAASRHVLLVVGAAGSETHAGSFAAWRDQLLDVLTTAQGVPPDRITVLSEGASSRDGVAFGAPTREGVRGALGRLARDAGPLDVVLVVLLGHGTFDGVDAKFNLVGPDLEAAEWAALVAPIKATVVFVNTASASAPFLARLAGPRRVVVTSTSSPAQRYDTVFAGFFVQAFADGEADLDKDSRVSVGEAYVYASTRAVKWYELRGQLATERAALDDNGDGVAEPFTSGTGDGALASRVFLDAAADPAPSRDPALSQLLARREALEAELQELQRKREFMPPGDYERELERVLVSLARLSREIRARS